MSLSAQLAKIHDDATAERLLTVAADLMDAQGQTALSVRRVADAAQTSHRAVYALFGSMHGLLDALATLGYRDLATRVGELVPTDDPVADLVRAGVVGFRGFATSRPAPFRLTFDEISPAALQQNRVVEAAIASYDALADWVARVLDAGLIDPSRTDADCIFAFHATCQGLACSELAAQPPPAGPGFWRGVAPRDFDAV